MGEIFAKIVAWLFRLRQKNTTEINGCNLNIVIIYIGKD